MRPGKDDRAPARQTGQTGGFWRAWRWMRFDICLCSALCVINLGVAFVTGSYDNVAWTLAYVALIGVSLQRSASAHRVGYQMGFLAFPFAARMPKDKADELFRRTMNLWDPVTPLVVHQMEVEDLERHANEA